MVTYSTVSKSEPSVAFANHCFKKIFSIWHFSSAVITRNGFVFFQYCFLIIWCCFYWKRSCKKARQNLIKTPLFGEYLRPKGIKPSIWSKCMEKRCFEEDMFSSLSVSTTFLNNLHCFLVIFLGYSSNSKLSCAVIAGDCLIFQNQKSIKNWIC